MSDELDRLRPTDGARYLLEHEQDGVYRAWIIAPAATYAYRVNAVDGSLEGDAPAELEKQLRAFVKVLTRDGAPWPARVLRWRR